MKKRRQETDDRSREKPTEPAIEYPPGQLLTGLATRFINMPLAEMEEGIHSALEEICTATRIDRGCIMLFSEDGAVLNTLSSYSRNDDPAQDKDMRTLPAGQIQWWIKRLKKERVYQCSDPDDLPDAAGFLRESRQRAGIKSQLDVPVFQHDHLIGIIGLSTCSQPRDFSVEDINLLRVFSEIIANALDRKSMEAALAVSESTSRNLLQATPMGMFIYQLRNQNELVLEYANPATGIILGKDYQGEIGKKMEEIFPNVEYTVMLENSLAVAREGQPWQTTDLQYSDERIAGAYDIQVYQISFNRIVVMFTDITERKQSEERIARNEERYRSIFNNIQDVYFELSGDMKILEVSPSVRNISGYTREELIGKDIGVLTGSEEVKHTFVKSLHEQKELRDYDVTLYDKDGSNIVCSVNVKLVPDLNADHDKAVGSLRDITEREAARHQISKLSTAVEQSSTSVVITDPEGNIEYVNPKFSEVTGYSRDEALGQNPRILKSGQHDEAFYQKMWQTILSGKEWRGEFHNKRKDGTTFWERASISGVKNHLGKITDFIAIKEDITEAKEVLQELKDAKEKAEESDRLKSAFLANMSHEIRTPMNAILGFSELLLHNDVSDENRAEYIQMIAAKGNELLAIISDLIDISRIEAGDMKLIRSEIRINRMIQDIYHETQAEMEIKGTDEVQLRFRTSEEIDPVVYTDRNRLKQVFTNLLGNAMKFTKSGYIEIGYLPDDQHITFYVKDTGIGIPKDKIDLIFERFRQADDSYTRKFGGTGLGLAISKQIIEMLDGKIWVDSKTGQGSCFYFRIPMKKVDRIREVETEKAKGIRHPVPDLSDRVILVVEDDISNFLFMESLLKKSNAETVWARDGVQAIQIFEERNDLDIILMDIRMPEMSGLIATEKIRDKNETIPIIALTAFAFVDDRNKALEAGCNEFLSKPIKVAELNNLLHQYLVEAPS